MILAGHSVQIWLVELFIFCFGMTPCTAVFSTDFELPIDFLTGSSSVWTCTILSDSRNYFLSIAGRRTCMSERLQGLNKPKLQTENKNTYLYTISPHNHISTFSTHHLYKRKQVQGEQVHITTTCTAYLKTGRVQMKIMSQKINMK